MTSFSQARVPASSPVERDPRDLERWHLRNSDAMQVGADNTSSVAFWTAFDKVGDYASGAQWNDTFQTILNVTGRGTLYGMIGPHANAASTQTWEVTVDGVAYTFAQAVAYSSRALVGRIARAGGQFITAGMEGGVAASTDLEARTDNITAQITYNTTQFLRQPTDIDRFIRFDVSLLIRAKNSAAANNGGARSNNCGAIWHLDT